MSLSTWSLIVFTAHCLFYSSMFIAVTFKASVTKISLMIIFWIINQVVILWYGIATNQIGFILIFILQFIVTLLTLIITTERSISENI
jgi:hypothetical protein